MALQDLTPQLRTRLSRLERAVGWFVVLATLLLAGGFFYYLYHTAQRKGWFLVKAPYYTFTDNAVGLKVGDSVKLMGFDAGRITVILPQPPGDVNNVYVEFEINEPNFGYLWTEGSQVKISPAGFLGQRELEVTKGKGGYATYLNFPLRELTLAEAAALPQPGRWRLAAEIRDAQTNLVFRARTPLSAAVLDRLAALGRTTVPVLDTGEPRKSLTVVWNDQTAAYETFGRTNLYFLLPDEAPALTARLERMLAKAEAALPRFLELATPLEQSATNAATLTAQLKDAVRQAQPAISNITFITGQLRGRGQLGEWLLPTNLNAELATTLTNANTTLVTAQATLATARTALANTDTNLTATLQSLGQSLEELSGITSNLHAQVLANTNILGTISTTIIHTDEFIQGLKRHWLFRSAFKTKPPPDTNAPPVILRSPRDAEAHQ